MKGIRSMPLLKFALSFIVGISISIQALADIKSPDDSLSSDQVIERANTLQDVDTTLVDGIPVVNAPCQFHKEASTPFPDDYKFKNPVFHEKFINHPDDDTEYAFTLTPNGMQGKYPSEYNNCRLVEDKGDNVTYKCNENYYRFHYVWRSWNNHKETGCFVHEYPSLSGTFNGIIDFFKDTYDWGLITDTCPPPTTKYDNEIEQCLTLDDVRPTLPDPIPECPAHKFTTTPLPKGTQFKNPLFAMEMENHTTAGGYLTPTPTSIGYRKDKNDKMEYFECDLIENNPTNITYYCKQLPYEDPGVDGFIRIRSVGFENKFNHPFNYKKCEILITFSPNLYNDLKDAFDFLNNQHPSSFTAETTSCGPSERNYIRKYPRQIIFPGDVCVPAK